MLGAFKSARRISIPAKVVLYLALALALFAILGQVAEERALLALGVPFAMAAAGLGCRKAAALKIRTALWLAGAGAVYLVLAGMGTGFAGKWAWSIVLGACAAWLVRAGSRVREGAWPSAGNLLIYFGILAGAFALLGPVLLWVPHLVPSGAKALGPAAALGRVLAASLGSFWGWALLLVLGLLGRVLLGRPGMWLAPGSLVVLAAFAAWALPWRADLLLGLLGASPWHLAGKVLGHAARFHGSAGYGLVALGFAAQAVLLPAWRAAVDQYRLLGCIMSLRERLGTTLAVLAARRAGLGPAEGLSVLVLWVLLGLLTVSLWVALRKMAGLAGTAFPLLGIPDLTVPHFRPVWHASYFAAAGLLTACQWFLWRACLRPALGEVRGPGPAAFVFSFAVLALIVPAGLVLFALGQTLALFLFLPAVVPARMEEARPAALQERRPEEPMPPRREEPRPEPGRAPEPAPPVAPQPDPYGTRLEEAAARLLFRHPRAVVGLALWRAASGSEPAVCLLDEEGRVFLYAAEAGRWASREVARVALVLGLAGTEEGVLAAGRDGSLVLWRPDGSREERHAGFALDRFAANPFGTMLALAAPGARSVVGFSLVAGGTFPLWELGAGSVTALAFSPDGRRLAVGGSDGRFTVVSMATRRPELELPYPAPGPAGAAAFAAFSRGDLLVAVYDSGLAACFPCGEGRGPEEETLSLRVVRLPARPSSLWAGPEAVTLGLEDGRVCAFAPDLASVRLREAACQEGPVTGVAVRGRELVAAGPDGTVRAVELALP